MGHYLPGYKAGGPVRTLANLIEWLGDELQFRVLTSDRDSGERQPYTDIERGTWQSVGKAQVLYLSPQELGLPNLHRTLNDLQYDLLYLNSFFSPLTAKIMFMRRVGLIPGKPIVLAPRGEFSPGALSLKRFKKRLYIFLARGAGLYKSIVWQASSRYEAQDISSVFGGDIDSETSSICIAPNLPSMSLCEIRPERRLPKQVGSVEIIFLSRIVRKKNLDVALKFLAHVSGKVQFDIYGPVEDLPYWQECQALISQLPADVQVRYSSVVTPDRVIETFSQYHLFLFPTRGENFGHVILEALCAGCLVLTSDQTPWRNLVEKRVGWDVPLSEPARFWAVLDEMFSMDDLTFREWSQSARRYGEEFTQNPALIQANRDLFLTALARY